MPTFDEYARGRDLGLLSESALGTLHTPKAPTEHYMIRRFDRDWPASLMTTYLDMLEAAQLWIDKQTALTSLLRVERPFEIGDDYYVLNHYPYFTSTKHIAKLDADEDPEVGALKQLEAEFTKASKAVTGEREVLLASILSRSVLTPNAWTFHSDADSRFVVVDPAATRAEGEMWLAHPSWHVNPG